MDWPFTVISAAFLSPQVRVSDFLLSLFSLPPREGLKGKKKNRLETRIK